MIVERHQDYQLTVATVPPGGVRNVPLQLDSDAPFALRLIKTRNLGPSGFMYQNPRRMYTSTGFQTDLIQSVTNDTYLPSRGIVQYPQIVYPPGASIVVDIANTTGEDLTNVKILFRGSKFFDSRAVSLPTYPAKFGGLPFTYQTIVQNLAAAGPLARSVDNQLQVRRDADFAYRCGVCDPFTFPVDGTASSAGAIAQPAYLEVYVQLRDEARKAYSNEPIHINDLFGQSTPFFGVNGNQNDDSVLWLPGNLTPEIYIPRDHSLYFDVFRFDDPTDFNTGRPVNLYFRFVGAKVFAQ
jgi:hypothetical protein